MVALTWQRKRNGKEGKVADGLWDGIEGSSEPESVAGVKWGLWVKTKRHPLQSTWKEGAQALDNRWTVGWDWWD